MNKYLDYSIKQQYIRWFTQEYAKWAYKKGYSVGGVKEYLQLRLSHDRERKHKLIRS